MKYTTWTDLVFGALARSAEGSHGSGVGLPAVAAVLGFEGVSEDDFAKHEGLPHALMSAMYDLEQIGLVKFENVGYGNVLTPLGRDIADAGLASLWPDMPKVHVSTRDAALLSELFEAAAVEHETWADLLLVDPYEAAPLDGTDGDAYAAKLARMTMLEDLERKGLIGTGADYGGDSAGARPTYGAVVLLSESIDGVPSPLGGSSDTKGSAPGLQPKPGAARPKGRPTGTVYIASREAVVEAYRKAILLTDRNPSRIPSVPVVAEELGVSARTLSDYLKNEGIPWPPE